MIFQFGQYKLDIDVEKTKKCYERLECVSEGCSCEGCRNYEKAVEVLPKEVQLFFESLGVDMKKIAEVYVNVANPDGSLYYGGFYHLCGTVLEGDSAWVKTGLNTAHWEMSKTYEVSKDLFVSFQNDVFHLADGEEFPRPVLQLEIAANIPWVLNEENTYPKSDSFCLYEGMF